MKYRRIVRTDGRLAGWQCCLMLMIGLISFLLLWLMLSPLFTALLPVNLVNRVTGLLIVFVGISGLIEVFSYCTRSVVPNFKIKKMRFGQKRIVSAILRRFTDTLIIYNLKLAIKTNIGYEMPAIYAYIKPDRESGFIAIENMGGKIANLDADNSSSGLSGVLATRRLRKYTFTSQELSEDGNFYIYYFEDTTTSHRLTVKNKNVEPFVSENKHILCLAKNLSWDASSTAHMSVIGRTRSGKSVFADYLCTLAILQGWKVEFNSIKHDIYVDKFHGQFEPEKIIERVEYWLKAMDKRNAGILKAGKSKYYEIDLPDVLVVIDEIGNLNGYLADNRTLKTRWISAINRLTATGASAGIHVLAMSQMGTKEAFLPSAARANCSDAVIMLGLAADSGDERRYMMPGFELPHRTYRTGQGLARLVTAGKMWEQPHFYETPYYTR
ncbi:cell division protein FtsK [Lactobacillus johnsonii]|uniref:cell division protein FtsK n=1 Tax=Lactobacillus johnsonii TaxID=33959 RepID=UPI00364C37C9